MANRSLLVASGFFCIAWAAPAAGQCRLCAPDPPGGGKPPPATAITIEIDSGIDFSRIGLVTANQGGTAAIDPVTGQRTVTGALVPLSGLTFQGTVTVRGEPNEHVAVLLPTEVTLSTTGGGTITLTGLTTTLKNNPKIDQNGMLTFGFGGQLAIDGNSHGEFRANIPITVDYR